MMGGSRSTNRCLDAYISATYFPNFQDVPVDGEADRIAKYSRYLQHLKFVKRLSHGCIATSQRERLFGPGS